MGTTIASANERGGRGGNPITVASSLVRQIADHHGNGQNYDNDGEGANDQGCAVIRCNSGPGQRHAMTAEDVHHFRAIGRAARSGVDYFGGFSEVRGAPLSQGYDGELFRILVAEIIEAVYRASGDAPASSRSLATSPECRNAGSSRGSARGPARGDILGTCRRSPA
jgi:hypothetical protein